MNEAGVSIDRDPSSSKRDVSRSVSRNSSRLARRRGGILRSVHAASDQTFEVREEPASLGDDGLGELDGNELEAAFSAAMEAGDDAVAAAGAVLVEETPGPASRPSAVNAATVQSSRPRVPPQQVLEAVLFVSGEPVTIRQLARVLETEDLATIERLLDELNHRYDREQRPYEVRLREGGYRMQLRGDYEPVRDRLYGAAPKEVRLTPEIVEILSLVAYEQPVTPDRLTQLPRKNVRRLVGQLVRRNLVELREEQGEKAYVTTDRFLDVLGLRELDDLPQPQVLAIR